MSNNIEEIMNRVAFELKQRNIAFETNAEKHSLKLPDFPKRENPDFMLTSVSVEEDNIKLCSFLMTERSEKPDPDYSDHVRALANLYAHSNILVVHIPPVGRLMLIQKVPFVTEGAFTNQDLEHVFAALDNVGNTTERLEEDIRDVFDQGTYPSSIKPEEPASHDLYELSVSEEQ